MQSFPVCLWVSSCGVIFVLNAIYLGFIVYVIVYYIFDMLRYFAGLTKRTNQFHWTSSVCFNKIELNWLPPGHFEKYPAIENWIDNADSCSWCPYTFWPYLDAKDISLKVLCLPSESIDYMYTGLYWGWMDPTSWTPAKGGRRNKKNKK